jgi:accessory gene regulator B
VKNKTIDTEEKEMYAYGLRQFILIFLNFITVLLLGFIFKMLWQAVLFTVLYIPLRSNSGGFHANSRLGCYIFSVVQIIATLSAIKYQILSAFICGIVLLFSSLCINSFSPIQDKHKELDKIEREVYRKRTLHIMSIELFIGCVAFVFNLEQVYLCVVFSMLNVSILQLFGMYKNARLKKAETPVVKPIKGE